MNEVDDLRERHSRGDLHAERVELAALLGHASAIEAIGQKAVPQAPDDLRDWVLALDRYGLEASVIVAVASARLGLEPDEPRGTPVLEAVLAAEALLACPCDKHEKAARLAWTLDPNWVNEVPWSELSAEVAWKAHWDMSEQVVRAAIVKALLPWALAPVIVWNSPGTMEL